MNETIKKNAWDTNGYMDRSHVADARTAPEEECFDGANFRGKTIYELLEMFFIQATSRWRMILCIYLYI